MKFNKIHILFFLIAFIFISCKDKNTIPKPRAYFRIDFHEKAYKHYDDD